MTEILFTLPLVLLVAVSAKASGILQEQGDPGWKIYGRIMAAAVLAFVAVQALV